jgi:hypothetical protein
MKKEFKNITELCKFERQNKGKIKIVDVDYKEDTFTYMVTFELVEQKN